MLHGVNRQKVTPGELGQVVSLDLGDVPENVINTEVSPLIKQLADILNKYKVYPWLSIGWHEDNTENNLYVVRKTVETN